MSVARFSKETLLQGSQAFAKADQEPSYDGNENGEQFKKDVPREFCWFNNEMPAKEDAKDMLAFLEKCGFSEAQRKLLYRYYAQQPSYILQAVRLILAYSMNDEVVNSPKYECNIYTDYTEKGKVYFKISAEGFPIGPSNAPTGFIDGHVEAIFGLTDQGFKLEEIKIAENTKLERLFKENFAKCVNVRNILSALSDSVNNPDPTTFVKLMFELDSALEQFKFENIEMKKICLENCLEGVKIMSVANFKQLQELFMTAVNNSTSVEGQSFKDNYEDYFSTIDAVNSKKAVCSDLRDINTIGVDKEQMFQVALDLDPKLLSDALEVELKKQKLSHLFSDYQEKMRLEIINELQAAEGVLQGKNLGQDIQEILNDKDVKNIISNSRRLRTAVEKYQSMDSLLKTLHTDKPTLQQLADCKQEFQKQQHTIARTRDSATMYLLKVVATIFSLGAAIPLGLWRSHGDKVRAEANALLPPKPKR